MRRACVSSAFAAIEVAATPVRTFAHGAPPPAGGPTPYDPSKKPQSFRAEMDEKFNMEQERIRRIYARNPKAPAPFVQNSHPKGQKGMRRRIHIEHKEDDGIDGFKLDEAIAEGNHAMRRT